MPAAAFRRTPKLREAMQDETKEATALAAAQGDEERMHLRRHAQPLTLDIESGTRDEERSSQRDVEACDWRAWPPQIFFIMGNEVCERLSFYGMRAILIVYMTEHLAMTAPDAESVFHLFTAVCYLLPLFGGWLADNLFGKYRVVLYLSTFYCLGHAALAVWESRAGLAAGLVLISIGAGGIKPCVAAMVGDQFDETNKGQLPSVFAMFYWCINFGSFAAMASIPVVMQRSVFWAFSIPGIFMAIALGIFWAGRGRYVLVEPALGAVADRPAGFFRVVGFTARDMLRRDRDKGFWEAARHRFSAAEVDAAQAVAGILQLFLCLSMFSALFDQHSSTWVIQAQAMDLNVLGWQMPPAQMQALNPVLVMFFIPFFETCVYPAVTSIGIRLTPLRKMSTGMLLTSLPFVIIAALQAVLDSGRRPSVLWQLPAYLLLTSSEVLVSVTGIQFAYSQAPVEMKSTIMSLWLLTVFLGNSLDAVVTKLNVFSGPLFFLFFVCLMLAVAGLFILVAVRYEMRDYSRRSTNAGGKASDGAEDADRAELLSADGSNSQSMRVSERRT